MSWIRSDRDERPRWINLSKMKSARLEEDGTVALFDDSGGCVEHVDAKEFERAVNEAMLLRAEIRKAK